jgi:hypothetical protein
LISPSFDMQSTRYRSRPCPIQETRTSSKSLNTPACIRLLRVGVHQLFFPSIGRGGAGPAFLIGPHRSIIWHDKVHAIASDDIHSYFRRFLLLLGTQSRRVWILKGYMKHYSGFVSRRTNWQEETAGWTWGSSGTVRRPCPVQWVSVAWAMHDKSREEAREHVVTVCKHALLIQIVDCQGSSVQSCWGWLSQSYDIARWLWWRYFLSYWKSKKRQIRLAHQVDKSSWYFDGRLFSHWAKRDRRSHI